MVPLSTRGTHTEKRQDIENSTALSMGYLSIELFLRVRSINANGACIVGEVPALVATRGQVGDEQLCPFGKVEFR